MLRKSATYSSPPTKKDQQRNKARLILKGHADKMFILMAPFLKDVDGRKDIDTALVEEMGQRENMQTLAVGVSTLLAVSYRLSPDAEFIAMIEGVVICAYLMGLEDGGGPMTQEEIEAKLRADGVDIEAMQQRVRQKFLDKLNAHQQQQGK
jgi:hypothetical protein